MRFLGIITISLILSLSAWAQRVSIKLGKIQLEGKSCSVLMKEAQSIWNKSAGNPICVCKDNCRIEITNILPKKISELAIKTNPEISGPNCWNSVLYVGGQSAGLTNSEDEMEFWLNSPLCSAVALKDARPGDIFNYYDDEGNLDHSNRLISPHLFFNKESFTILDYYQIVDAQKYLANYKSKYLIYRCQNFEPFRLANDELLKAQSDLQGIGDKLTGITLGKKETVTKDDVVELRRLNQLALSKLGIPAWQKVSTQIIKEIQVRMLKGMPVAPSIRDEVFNYYVQRYSLFSYPTMQITSLTENENTLINLFKENKVYEGQLDQNEFIAWAQILLNANTMADQLASLLKTR